MRSPEDGEAYITGDAGEGLSGAEDCRESSTTMPQPEGSSVVDKASEGFSGAEDCHESSTTMPQPEGSSVVGEDSEKHAEGSSVVGEMSETFSGAEDCPESSTTRPSCREESLEGQDSAPEEAAASNIPLVASARAESTGLEGQDSVPGEAYLGIDIGSISTKGVIIDSARNIIARSYLWTEGNPAQAAKNVVAELRAQIDPSHIHILGIGTTGSARRLVGAMFGANVIKNEITAHAVGTTYLHPDVRTILEIGGQDSKIICLDGGVAIDYAMNTLCAAGTGAFLSSQAQRLGVDVEDFGEIALTSENPANIAARCTVFAESDLVHKIQMGYAREDIIAGLCSAVVSNYLNNVGKGKKITAPVVFQGGVSKNKGVVHAFEEHLEQDVIVDEDGHLMGAFGAALLAADAGCTQAQESGPFATGEFDFDAALDFDYTTREIECGQCANNCEIICVYRDRDLIDSWGNRCDRGSARADATSGTD